MDSSTFRKISLTLVVLAISAGLTAGGFYFGYQKGQEKPKQIVVQGITDTESQEKNIDFNLFWEAWRLLKDKEVNSDKITNQDLLYGAISGIFGAFKDQNNIFLPPSEVEKFKQDISGEFSGIGAEIGIKKDQLVIIAPLKDSPAEASGLRANDKIFKIDKTDTFGLTVDEAVKLIRGEKGTTVVLTVLRNGWETTKEFSIVREIIQIPTLDSKMEGDLAYIHLYNFYEKAPYVFYQTAIKIALQNPKGMVLDLRNNPGGYLDASVNLAGWFLEPGQTVVSEEYGDKTKDVFKARGNGLFKNLPIVILINQGSASASEILAGALRDIRGVKLIGQKSFGKGTVQEINTLSDGSLAKITVANWIMPKGGVIEKNGLTPDYTVDLTDDDIKNNRDPQLDKAMEILRSEIKGQ